jgi:hypothetical protein
VTKIELDGDPEILDINGKEATVQMTFKTSVDISLSYDDSSTGSYDSEDTRMVFMDHVNETVSREEDLVVEVQVSFDGVDPDAFEVDDVNLVDPSGDQRVSTSKWEGYPWK